MRTHTTAVSARMLYQLAQEVNKHKFVITKKFTEFACEFILET